MNTLFASLLSWIVQFVLFVPFQFLKLAGLLFPPCSSIGFFGFTTSVTNSMVNWILFLWPVIKYIPWTFVWNFVSAVFLFIFFRFVWKNLPKLLEFVMSFWWVIVIFYVVAGLISVFTGYGWMDSPVFSEVFGSSPTTTGSVGGGFGGGGGGSW